MFELLLFHTDFEFDQKCIEHGVSGLIVDLETKGKELRQKKYPTQINAHTLQDIVVAKSQLNVYTICRINGVNSDTHAEVQDVLYAGADEILIPMVRTLDEIDFVLNCVDNNCSVSVMLETVDLLKIADEINNYPLKRIYMGLTDLWIERKTPHIFSAIADGTVDAARKAITKIPFGFAGLTLPNKGYPLPVRHLFNELARLQCGFSFLRRSFVSDIKGKDIREGVQHILAAIQQAALRSKELVCADYCATIEAINEFRVLPTLIGDRMNATKITDRMMQEDAYLHTMFTTCYIVSEQEQVGYQLIQKLFE